MSTSTPSQPYPNHKITPESSKSAEADPITTGGAVSSSLRLTNPRCKDDPAWFDLWCAGIGAFRLPIKEETRWIMKTFGCENLEISDPFLIMTNPKKLPHSRTVGSLVLAINQKLEDIHPFWQAGCSHRGNPRIRDPLNHLRSSSYVEIAAAILERFPSIIEMSFFWNSILVHPKELTTPSTIPARFAGRNVGWFHDGFRIGYPLLKSKRNIIPTDHSSDGSLYDPVHAGVRVTCQDGSRSTTLGAALRHPDGRHRVCVANHGFPDGGVVYHPYNEIALGTINEVYPDLDIALVELYPGIQHDTTDYFEIPPPNCLLGAPSCRIGDSVYCDGYSTGPLAFTVTSMNVKIQGADGSDLCKLELSPGIFPSLGIERLLDRVCGAPLVLELEPEMSFGMIGQFYLANGNTECFVLPVDKLIEDGWEVASTSTR